MSGETPNFGANNESQNQAPSKTMADLKNMTRKERIKYFRTGGQIQEGDARSVEQSQGEQPAEQPVVTTATEQPLNTEQPTTNESQGARERNLSRRGFLAGAAAMAAVAGGTAIASQFFGRSDGSNESAHDGGNVSPDDLNSEDNYEADRFTTVRGTLEYIDRKAFTEDQGKIFHNPQTSGGHFYAYENGEETEHWVGFHEELKNDSEFLDHFAGDSYNGLATEDDYGAFFEHLSRNTIPVIAAELIALRHPDFADLTMRDVEQKLLSNQAEAPENNESLLEWLKGQHSNTNYEFVPIPQNEVIMNMGILDPGVAEHGRFIQYNTDELLRDEHNHLVQATTVLENGTTVTRWINPVCMNLLNKIKYEEPGNPPTETTIITPDDDPTPETPPETPPDQPKDAENLSRIDENAHEDIAQNNGTDEVRVSQTPSSEVESQTPTSRPSGESYQGTSATTTQNSASAPAETVRPQASANDYGQNRGGANAGEYAPVSPNSQAQSAANSSEIPISEAPTSGEEVDDILNDLGIN